MKLYSYGAVPVVGSAIVTIVDCFVFVVLHVNAGALAVAVRVDGCKIVTPMLPVHPLLSFT
ncbi:hypothetical protein D3C87_1656330 [compost metagenome]